MNKLTAASPQAQSADLVAGNIEQLKALFPELITEGANGVAVSSDNTSSAAKPFTVSSDKQSTPQHTTASAKPARNSRAALIKARAPEVQAVEIT